MSCDFSTYNQLRNDTQAKSAEAKAACDAEATAQAALVDAQATLQAAQANKIEAYDAWQKAKRAENAEAIKLGIDPIPAPPPTV